MARVFRALARPPRHGKLPPWDGGGSDTSAVALAAAPPRQKSAKIYTDVPGILTTRYLALCQRPSLMAEITSDEMLELASLGAKVLHPPSGRNRPQLRRYPGGASPAGPNEPGTRVVSPRPPAPPPGRTGAGPSGGCGGNLIRIRPR